MIARVWCGRTLPEDADAYVAHLRKATLPLLRAIKGHRGAYVLRRDAETTVDFLVMTLWELLDAVRAFAGDDYGVAMVPGEAERLLTEYERRAMHFEVTLASE